MSSENIKFVCEHCQHLLQAPANLAGDSVDCPNCHKYIPVLSMPEQNESAGNVSIFCHHCGFKLQIPSKLLGQTAECPACKKEMMLPSAVSIKPSKMKNPSDDVGFSLSSSVSELEPQNSKLNHLALAFVVASIIFMATGFVVWFYVIGKSSKGEGTRISESSPSVSTITLDTKQQSPVDENKETGHNSDSVANTLPSHSVANTPSKDFSKGEKNFEGHYYKVVWEPTTFKEAQDICVKGGGHLVVIDTESENKFIKGLFVNGNSKNKGLWIGLADENGAHDWTWVDGTKPSLFHWARPFWGGPGKGNAVVIAHIKEPTWQRVSPGSKNGFICEWDK